MSDFPEKLGRRLDQAKLKPIDREIGMHIGRSVLNSTDKDGWIHVSEDRAQNTFAKAVAAGRLYQNESKSNINRSEGIKRVCLIISVLFVVSWIIFVLFETKGFTRSTSGINWVIIVAGIPISYYFPKSMLKIGHWVFDGFKQTDEK